MLAMSSQTEERVSVSVFVDQHDRKRLVELVRRHDRSMSAEIRRAIAAHVEHD
jgi:predicted transcriptional regulator